MVKLFYQLLYSQVNSKMFGSTSELYSIQIKVKELVSIKGYPNLTIKPAIPTSYYIFNIIYCLWNADCYRNWYHHRAPLVMVIFDGASTLTEAK